MMDYEGREPELPEGRPVPVRTGRRRSALAAVVALNVVAAIVAYLLLDTPLGWLAADRPGHSGLVGYGLPLAQLLLFAYLADLVFRQLLQRWLETEGAGRPTPRLGIQLGRIMIYFCMAAAAASLVFNQSITGVLAASGVVGLVAGFALRGLVSDLFSGIALHIDRNISVGDWIEIFYRGRELIGQVKDIHWRSVVLQDPQNNTVLVPNSEFATSVVVNRSKPGPASTYAAYIPLGNEYESGRVLAVLEIVLHHLVSAQLIHSDPAPLAQIAQIEGGVVRYRLVYSIDPNRITVQDAQSRVLQSALQFLRAAGFYLYPLLPNYVSPDQLPPDRLQNPQVRLRVLAGVALLRVLPPAALERMAAGAEVRYCPAGTVIVRAGEISNAMWIISEGMFDIVVERTGGSAVVATLWPGEWFGEMSLLTGEATYATVRARIGSLVFCIAKPLMEPFFEADPGLVGALAQIAGRRRKARETPGLPISAAQDAVRIKSTIDRIRAFFGLPQVS